MKASSINNSPPLFLLDCLYRSHSYQLPSLYDNHHHPHSMSHQVAAGYRNAMANFAHIAAGSSEFEGPHKSHNLPPSSSPVSHRNLNKRVAQKEANDFLCLSGNGRGDAAFDEGYGLEEEEEEVGYDGGAYSYPHYGGRGGFARDGVFRSTNPGQRRGHSKSFSGPYSRRLSSAAAHSNGVSDRVRKPYTPRGGHGGNAAGGGRKRNLLNFILELLTTRQTCVEWVDKPKQVFQIVNPDQLTKLWGEHKNNVKMSFESLSRSLR